MTDACLPRHRQQEFLRFLKKVAGAYPGVDLHVVCDNYSTHKHAAVRAWLAKNPRVMLHFTPTGCSWINLVECFFSVITRRVIRRGSFTSVSELVAPIGAFIESWNDHPHPFAWTKDADEILASINRATTKNALTGHNLTRAARIEAAQMRFSLGGVQWAYVAGLGAGAQGWWLCRAACTCARAAEGNGAEPDFGGQHAARTADGTLSSELMDFDVENLIRAQTRRLRRPARRVPHAGR